MISGSIESENEKRWLLLCARVSEENIKTAFRQFRENGVEPVLVKGWAAARVYPERFRRSFTDIDLCVSPEEFEKSRKFIKTEKFNNLNIDLHCGLRHLDTVDWEKLFESSSTVLIDDVPVRILRSEDHLRVLCVHWLTDGGAYKEKLLDIYYLLESASDNFDWNYCFKYIDENRRDWIIKTIALVHRYYGLDILRLPFADKLGEVPAWIVQALEREWESDRKLTDIYSIFDNKREFWIQLKKRFRPNPIQSTVFMEGSFGDSAPVYYQIGSFFKRIPPSIKRAAVFLTFRVKRRF